MERGSTRPMPTTVDPAVTPERGLGDALAAAGGLVLFVSLFIVWYGIGFKEDVEESFRDAVEGERGGAVEIDPDATVNLILDAFDRSAWEAFSVLDILLTLLAFAVVALALARLLRRAPDLPISPGLLMAALGGLALLIVLIRILFTPNLEIDTGLPEQQGVAKAKDIPGVEVERHFWGPFFAFLASLGMIAGGLLTAGGRRAVDAVRAGQVRGERPMPPIEPEPAAPAGAPMQPPPDEGPATEAGAVRAPREGGGEDRLEEEEEDRQRDEDRGDDEDRRDGEDDGNDEDRRDGEDDGDDEDEPRDEDRRGDEPEGRS